MTANLMGWYQQRRGYDEGTLMSRIDSNIQAPSPDNERNERPGAKLLAISNFRRFA